MNKLCKQNYFLCNLNHIFLTVQEHYHIFALVENNLNFGEDKDK